MRQVRRGRFMLAAVLLAGCGEAVVKPAVVKPAVDTSVGYELRRLRPRDGERLAAMFDRLREAAVGEGKRVAVLFSADWCEPCRVLETELGNRHSAAEIGDVRIFELKEEDWTAATRLDEFEGLRRRWSPVLGSYPLLILLDDKGGQREEMKEAITRLEAMGIEPTLANWLADTRPG
jgi:thiol:disulfide interchange protein